MRVVAATWFLIGVPIGLVVGAAPEAVAKLDAAPGNIVSMMQFFEPKLPVAEVTRDGRRTQSTAGGSRVSCRDLGRRLHCRRTRVACVGRREDVLTMDAR